MAPLNQEAALAFILRTIERKALAPWGTKAPDMIRDALALDLSYMEANNVLTPDGTGGDAFYDDDEAFEYILEGLVERYRLSDAKAAQVGLLVDAYMEAQEAYMNEEGLLHWE